MADAEDPPPPAPAPPPRASAPARALEKLGLHRDIDLALHLPLRYEDETRLTPIAALHDGDTAQVEGTVTESRIQFRPRRQLVVRLNDGDEVVSLALVDKSEEPEDEDEVILEPEAAPAK